MKTLLIISLVSSAAMATGSHGNTPVPIKPDVHNTDIGVKSSSDASAAAAAAAKASSESKSHAESGSSAVTGPSSASVGVTSISNGVRQVPPVILSTVLANGCGNGISAGGSGSGGAGAFGFSWTTEECYAFMSGSNWIALGEYEAACVVWADVNRKAFKRQGYKPDCTAIAKRLNDEAMTHSAPVNSVTREQVQEMVERAFTKSVSK